MSRCSGAALAWSSCLRFDFLPDTELCQALQVGYHLNGALLTSLMRPLRRQTVSRILALEALPRGIQTEERFVDVAAIPIGIDVAALSEKRYVAAVAT